MSGLPSGATQGQALLGQSEASALARTSMLKQQSAAGL